MNGSVAGSLTRILLVVAAAAVGGSWWFVSGMEQQIGPIQLIWFLIAAIATERLAIRQPGGQAVPTSLAVLGAAAILGASPLMVAAIAAAAWFVGRFVGHEPLELSGIVNRIAGAWALTGLASLGSLVLPVVWEGSGSDVSASLPVGAAIAVGLAIVVGLPAGEIFVRTGGRWHVPLRRAREAIMATRLVGPAVAATAGLGALVHPVLGIWTLPTMLIPLLAARVGLERLFVADRAYEQTIRAMSRLPEQMVTGPQGSISDDHGVRVGELAREVAHELGLSEHDTIDVVRAAHMHELGRLKLEAGDPATQRELASAGGQAVRMVSARLERVAQIVEAHGDLAGPVAQRDDLRQQVRIVAACCEIDRYAPDPIEPAQLDEVVVRLVRDVGDLEVVSALTRVLRRQRVAVH
ncbi:MAG: hypothetical protein LC679_19095 [Intrasporangiaceae bacterium]|nr:hypothetical protein [Intrasporangiaceae bacterium]